MWRSKYPCAKFKGIDIEQMPLFEEMFSVNVNVYSLQPDNTATMIYRSPSLHPKTMNLNVYQGHLSLISNFKNYAAKFTCSICNLLCNNRSNLLRHIKICSDTKEVHPGGFYESPKNIWDKLSDIGFTVRNADQTYPYYLVYDFESMLVSCKKSVGAATTITKYHTPISVSVASNIVNGPTCYVESTPTRLIDLFVSYLESTQQMAAKMMNRRLKVVLDVLDTYVTILVSKQ